MRWWPVWLVLFTVGCDEQALVTSQQSATDHAVGRCALAMVEMSHTLVDGGLGFDVLPAYAKGCADVYQRAACRAAWQREGTKTRADANAVDSRIVAITKACGTAYCPMLAAPKPKLCTTSAVGEEVAAQWPALHTAILDHDLKRHPELARALKTMFTPIVVRLDLPQPAQTDEVQIVLGVEIAANGQVAVDGKPVADDAALLKRAKQAVADNRDLRAVIRADVSVRHGQVIQVLDLLKQAGVKRIAFGVTPVDEPDGGTSGR
jgi:biopolymer transport protein ExbD